VSASHVHLTVCEVQIMWIVAGVIIATVSSGCSVLGVRGPPAPCTSASAAYVVPGLDAHAALIMPAVILIGSRIAGLADNTHDRVMDVGDAVKTAAWFSVPLAISSGVGFWKITACRSAKRAASASAEDSKRTSAAAHDRERAWMLTRNAASAARAGDCATVIALDAEISELDPAFHTKVFLADVGIKNCLDQRGP
jgi:hypothetical protein